MGKRVANVQCDGHVFCRNFFLPSFSGAYLFPLSENSVLYINFMLPAGQDLSINDYLLKFRHYVCWILNQALVQNCSLHPGDMSLTSYIYLNIVD